MTEKTVSDLIVERGRHAKYGRDYQQEVDLATAVATSPRSPSWAPRASAV